MKDKGMAVEERVAAAGTPERVKKPATREESAAGAVAAALFWALMGLLAPRVSVYGGLSPFGVGVAAAANGAGALLTYAAVAVGYLLSGDTLFLLRYLAAAAIAAGIRWAFSGLRGAAAARWLPPMAGFAAAVTAGFAVGAMGGLTGYAVLALLCEGVLAGGFARLCAMCHGLRRPHAAREQGLSAGEQVAVTAVAAVAVMALVEVSVGDISLGRILAAVLVLLFARSGKEQGGGIAGIALGTALLLTHPQDSVQAAALAFGGLMAGLFARYNRFAAAGMYLIITTLVAMAGGDGTVMARAAYEAAAASVLFVLLPASLDRRINGLFLRGQELPAVEGLRRSVVWRLDDAARAMEEVAGTVDAVSRRMAKLSAPDLGTLCREAAQDCCAACPQHTRCWDGGYADTMASFNHLTDALRRQGQVTADEAVGRLAECPQAGEIVRRINEGYGRFSVRESAFRRLGEIRAVAGDQFYAMASMLTELSAVFSDPAAVDEQAAARVRAVCEQHGLAAQEVLCTLDAGGRMEVSLVVPDTDLRFDEALWRQQVSDACGRALQRPEIARMGSTARVLLRERPRYRIEVGRAQLCCRGEQLCGDAAELVSDPQGRTVLVLSDGMGCGGRAAVDGAMAAGLSARLIRAGFGADSVLRMVNAALMVKGGDESLATLDIAAVDPFTGRLDVFKAGAALSLLRSGGRVSRMERASLPLGILRDVSFERSGDTLSDGDILLMCSDGAFSEGTAAAEELLRGYHNEESGADGASLQNLAESVAAAARAAQRARGGREDDITVMAAQVRVCPHV